jgi:hypothetical protein
MYVELLYVEKRSVGESCERVGLVNKVCRSRGSKIGNSKGFKLALVSRIVPSVCSLGFAVPEKGKDRSGWAAQQDVMQHDRSLGIIR